MLSDPRPGSTAGFPMSGAVSAAQSGTMTAVKRDEFWKVVGLAVIAAVALGALLSVGISVFAEVAEWFVQRMSQG